MNLTNQRPPRESSGELFRALTKRPAAITLTVRELLKKLNDGEIRVPNFQRPLRWRGSDVLALLDSIWRGYPVGSLLFWKRPAPEAIIKIGSAHVQAPAVQDAWWVVDGQQRTTALAASLLNLDQAGDRRWQVYFDPEAEEFHSGAPRAERLSTDCPLSELGDLRRLGRWLRNCSLSESQIDRVEQAQQRLLDYAMPAYVVETDDEQVLRGVFARANSSGARMRADEVFQALLGAPSASGQSSLDLDALQESCAADGFGVPARVDILKSVLAMSGGDPNNPQEALGGQLPPNLPSLEDAREALSRTVDFFRSDCLIPHVSLIPYPVAFIILSRWFYLYPETDFRLKNLLARWVWRAVQTGAHQRAEVSKMRHQVRDIQPDDVSDSLDRLLSRIKRPLATSWELKPFNLKSAHSRIEVLALLEQKPEDKLGRVTVADLLATGRVAREILRTPDLVNLNDSARELARTAANRVLLGGVHTGLKSEIERWSWPASESLLSSHLIGQSSAEAFHTGQFGNFLTIRGQEVESAVSDLLEKRSAWESPDTRPASFYSEPIGED